MLKTFKMSAAVLALLVSGQTQMVLGADNCMALATDLAKRGGGEAMEVIKKLNSDSELTAKDLNVSDETFASAQEYVSSGCAMDHLQTAVNAANTASEMGGALKGLGF